MAPPVLIVGDAASSSTGLGRILSDIAKRADANLKDICRIATLGYGGPGSRKFNFQQYAIEGMKADFVIPNLPDVWRDWAGSEPGVILFIWDASRLGWFSRPNVMCEEESLKLFLVNADIQRWIYCPVDAEGPHGRLSYPYIQALLGFDRVLAYGEWAGEVLRKSLGNKPSQERDLGAIPHGIDGSVFYPRDRALARAAFYTITGAVPLQGSPEIAVFDDEPLVGAVATNQDRKDWGLWAEACALFLSRHPKAQFWIHTDILERSWSIPALLVDFGLIGCTAVSLGYLNDEQMAQAYSACDLTLGIGAGEGFGFPIAESLFCGTPVVHGRYAGAVDYLPDDMLIKPVTLHMEGLYASKRPVFDATDWVNRMEYLLGKRVNCPSQLDWENVWPRFETWFRKGLGVG